MEARSGCSAVEALRFDGVANGVGVDVQVRGQWCRSSSARRKSSGESARGFPGLIMCSLTFARGMRGKGSTKRPLRPHTTQRQESEPEASPADAVLEDHAANRREL